MSRYFIEVSYKGTAYSGFQIQENSSTIQSEIEKAFETIHRYAIVLTGSSRTDAGVHALQNYFHFDTEKEIHDQVVYKMNAILPGDISVRNLFPMPIEAHSRFDAVSREYEYRIHSLKDPFLKETSWYFPYKLDFELMQEAASFIKEQTNFFAFAKTNSQVKTYNCSVTKSEWLRANGHFIYSIEANRFLRGMVRLLTATLLNVGRHKITLDDFHNYFRSEVKSGYSVPSHGLFLKRVNYPENYFPAPALNFTRF